MREGTDVRRHDARGAAAWAGPFRHGAASPFRHGAGAPPSRCARHTRRHRQRPLTDDGHRRRAPLGPDGQPRRRRRRGSRGGRNRKKPGTAGADGGANGADRRGGDRRRRRRGRAPRRRARRGRRPRPDHRRRRRRAPRRTPGSPADTTPSEIGDAEPASVRPSRSVGAGSAIGDSRPAPRIGDSRPGRHRAPRRVGVRRRHAEPGTAERRRGARGRGRRWRGGGAARADGQPAAARSGGPDRSRGTGAVDDVVRADLGVDDEPALALDDDVLERRRGRTRKGRPAGRYLMCVHVLEGGHTHIAVLEGRSLVEHTPRHADRQRVDRRQHLPRPGAERAARAWRPRSSTSARRRTACSTGATSRSTRPTSRAVASPKIERMLKNGQSVLVQVTKNPIAHKGARLTQEVSLAGRFLVMVPGEPETYGISKRLPDDERKRLRRDPRRPPSRRTPGSSCAPRPRARRATSSSATSGACAPSGSRSPTLAGQVQAGQAPLPGARRSCCG